MKPNDKAYAAAIKIYNIHSDYDAESVSLRLAVDAAFAAQFQSEDYAELIKALRSSSPYTLSHVAADALEAVLAERDALKAENESMTQSLPLWAHKQMAANSALIERLRAERDALLAPVEDKELVEIAADAISTYVPDQVSKWGSIKDAAIDAIAAIRPHIEAAERERIKSKLREIDAASRTGGIFTLDSIIAEIDAPQQSGAGNE